MGETFEEIVWKVAWKFESSLMLTADDDNSLPTVEAIIFPNWAPFMFRQKNLRVMKKWQKI